MKNRILVIRGGAIGDFILTLPVFGALKSQFEHCAIDVLGYSHIAQLAHLTGHIENVHSIEARGLAGFFAKGGNLDPSLKELFSQYGLILSYLFDPEEIFKTNVGRASKAQFIVGPHRPDESMAIHATEVFLDPLKSLAIFDSEICPRIEPDLVPRISVPECFQKDQFTLAVHPGSGSELKNWDVENWVSLIKLLTAETDIQFLFIGGEADRDRFSMISDSVSSDRKAIAFGLSLNELAGHLNHADGFLGHDSGISHLAAALGLPGIVLWPSTNHNIWGPRSEKFRLIFNENGVNGISVVEVFDRILKYFIGKSMDT